MTKLLVQGQETAMLDLIFIATTIVFFFIALAYLRFCEKQQ